ncbi:MAG: MFS transporter [Planctomycetes bacterium]|nr:MFS transporter [Planctomycetota bacterium]
MSPTTIIPAFLHEISGSKITIGLFGIAHTGGWYLPQIFAAGLVERHRRKKWIYLMGNGCRMALTGLAFIALFLLAGTHPTAALALFLSLYGLGLCFGGVAGLCFTEMVGSMIPAHRRGAFFSLRFLLGGSALTILTGVIVQEVLSRPQTFPYPSNYAFLFSLGWLMMVLGTALFALVREKPGEVDPHPRPVLAAVHRFLPLLRTDARLRHLILNRLLATASQMSWPFFVVFAAEDLKLGAGAAGVFLIAQTVGSLVGNLGWGWLSGRFGNCFIIRFCSVLEWVAPTYAFLAGEWLIHHATELTPGWIELILSPIFFLIGMTSYGGHIGMMSHLLEIAPPECRPTYIGILCSAMGIGTLTPLLGGYLAEWVDLPWIFLLSSVCAAAALRTSLRLGKTLP